MQSFLLTTKTVFFHENIFKKSATPQTTNALTTPSEPENPSNIKTCFDTALLFFYSMMY